jgi:DNA-binding MarR family transcriptional regulator
MEDERERVIRSMFRRAMVLFNKYQALDKRPIDFGTGDLLTPAEIHTIEAIGDSPGINGRDLAEKMGVTKGAVSQMVKKLASRGFIKKARDLENEREVLHLLTEAGEAAYKGHDDFHKRIFSDLIPLMGGISLEQFERVDSLLTRLDQYIDRYLEGDIPLPPHDQGPPSLK